jgi:hypothetical protein
VTGAYQFSDTVCQPCPAGTFAPNYGSTVCAACPLGSYSSYTGTINCTSCWSDEGDTCNASTPGRCYGYCNYLKFRANPDTASGRYLCQYSASRQANTPEYPCTIPLADPTAKRKTSCDFEKSLRCNFQPSQNSDTVMVECWAPSARKQNGLT